MPLATAAEPNRAESQTVDQSAQSRRPESSTELILGVVIGAIYALKGLEVESRFPDADSEIEEVARFEFGIAVGRFEFSGELLALQ
jgi:hypothetical protein